MKIPNLLLFIGISMIFSCKAIKKDEPIVGDLYLDNPTAKMGETFFMEHCQKCHPGGEAGLGPALNNKYLPGFLIRFQVRNGVGKMPKISKKELSKKQLQGVVAYMKVLRKN